MSILNLNRDVFNDYNLNYDPVGLRNISLPNSLFTPLNAYEFNTTPQTLNNKGLVSFMDNAGLPESDYEEFTEVAKPGFNMDFAKQLGSTALGVITGNPFVGLIARGLGSLAGTGRVGIRGGMNLRGDSTLDTFGRSTSIADFMQRQRDKKAVEAAQKRGALKELQSRIDKGDFDGGNKDDAPGGAASNQDAGRTGQYG
tara:strand:+ start:682 stop:1278 length:597 start_codon:yes stop_codon:yes gene_type:complete